LSFSNSIVDPMISVEDVVNRCLLPILVSVDDAESFKSGCSILLLTTKLKRHRTDWILQVIEVSNSEKLKLIFFTDFPLYS
jgi:hypothetical protein